MSFIATGTGNPDLPAIQGDPFFPPIVPAAFRAATRQDDTVSDARLQHTLQIAVDDVNRRLAAWRQATAPSAEKLSDVSAAQIGDENRLELLYRRAVYATAKAELAERYKDYDATQSGVNKADDRQDHDDTYRRDASWAIADITGRPRTTVELI